MSQLDRTQQISIDVSAAFAAFLDAYAELEKAVADTHASKLRIKQARHQVSSCLTVALRYFHSNPTEQDTPIFHGIVRLARDTGFAPLADQLLNLKMTQEEFGFPASVENAVCAHLRPLVAWELGHGNVVEHVERPDSRQGEVAIIFTEKLNSTGRSATAGLAHVVEYWESNDHSEAGFVCNADRHRIIGPTRS